jgi:hypothetical protein
VETLSFSGEKLLNLDRKKYFPRLVEILANGDPKRRNAVLFLIHPYLTREHVPYVIAILGDDSLVSVEKAAQVLWDNWGDERGVMELMKRLRAAKNEKEAEFSSATFDLLARCRSNTATLTICDLMLSPINRLRMLALSAAAQVPSRKAAEILVSSFGDKAPSGWSSNDYDLRYCDAAAGSLIKMLDLTETFRLQSGEEDRDGTIAALKSWWDKNCDSIDWAAQARRLEDTRRRKGD